MKPLLSIKNLTVAVGTKMLVDQVSFDVPQGKIVAIAGGSGSGKTTIGLSILRLLPSALNIKQGSIVFEGQIYWDFPSDRNAPMPGSPHRHGLSGAFKRF